MLAQVVVSLIDALNPKGRVRRTIAVRVPARHQPSPLRFQLIIIDIGVQSQFVVGVSGVHG